MEMGIFSGSSPLKNNSPNEVLRGYTIRFGQSAAIASPNGFSPSSNSFNMRKGNRYEKLPVDLLKRPDRSGFSQVFHVAPSVSVWESRN